MKIFIVEDNTSHLNVLKAKVESLGYQIAGTSQTASEALSDIKKTSPDVVLIDINLDGNNDGIVLAKQIKEISTASMLFITAQSKDEIIQDAIAVEPSGYLIKPVDLNELKANIELAMYQKTQTKSRPNLKTEKEFLTVRTGQKLQLLPFKEIKILRVDIKNYVTLVDDKGKEFAVRDSLKNILNSVLPDCFIRTHHSYGVNMDFVLFIDEREQVLHLKTNDSIPIGKSFKEEVYQRMNIKS